MRFMPREWVEAQGFVWADAILATALLALAALSYVMLAHMLRSWGDGPQNASMTGARASPTDGGHDPASAAGNGRSASCAEYGPVKGEIEGMTALMRASSQGCSDRRARFAGGLHGAADGLGDGCARARSSSSPLRRARLPRARPARPSVACDWRHSATASWSCRGGPGELYVRVSVRAHAD